MLFLLAGCSVLGPTYTGETVADQLLKSDTEKNINLVFKAVHNCTPDKIHTQIDDVKINENTQTVEFSKETWTVSGCNNTDIFNVNYVSDGRGGTYINVMEK